MDLRRIGLPLPLQRKTTYFSSYKTVVLLCLLCYFAFRVVVEYLQHPHEARHHNAAKADFWVAHGIAFLAVIVLAVQRLLQIQIVSELGPETFSILAGGLLIVGLRLAGLGVMSSIGVPVILGVVLIVLGIGIIAVSVEAGNFDLIALAAGIVLVLSAGLTKGFQFFNLLAGKVPVAVNSASSEAVREGGLRTEPATPTGPPQRAVVARVSLGTSSELAAGSRVTTR